MSMNKTVQLCEAAKIQAGHPFRGRIPEWPGSNVVAVQMRDTDLHAGICWQTCIPTKPSGLRQPTWLKEGQLLFVARGTRYYAVPVEGVPAGYRAIAAPQFFIIDVFSDQLLPSFLAWQLNQEPCQQYFGQHAVGSLAKSIRRSVLDATPIVVPPLAKQQPIVGLANTLQEEKRAVEQLVSNGERLLAGIAAGLLDLKGR